MSIVRSIFCGAIFKDRGDPATFQVPGNRLREKGILNNTLHNELGELEDSLGSWGYLNSSGESFESECTHDFV